MAQEVKGFLANDGNFFISEAEADIHNAELVIRAYCVSHTPVIDADRFIEVVEALAAAVKDYLDATNRAESNKELAEWEEELVKAGVKEPFDTRPHDFSESETDLEEDQVIHVEGEVDAGPVFEQQIDGYEPVSDMGDGSQSEGVRDEREGDGTGSGISHARSVRRRKDLAAKRQTRPE